MIKSMELPCAKPLIIVTYHDLMSKPIQFWATLNRGRSPNGRLSKASSEIKRIVGYRYGNSILYFEFYGLLYSVGIYVRDGFVEVTIFAKCGDCPVYKMKRDHKSGQKFTHEEVNSMINAARDDAINVWNMAKENER